VAVIRDEGVVLTKSQAMDLLYVSSIIAILGRDVGVDKNQSEIDAESREFAACRACAGDNPALFEEIKRADVGLQVRGI
jgi:hypothetical protein